MKGKDLFQSQKKFTEAELEPTDPHAFRYLMGKAKNMLPLVLPKYHSTYVQNTVSRDELIL